MNNLISYAMSFASYLIQNTDANIRNIILFGSAARGDYSKESDIDIFVDTLDDIEDEIQKIMESFFNSVLYKKYWNLLGTENELSVKTGDISKWDLKRSIISHGIVLYGKYKEEIEGKLYSVFVINTKKKRSENVKIWRKLYGYKQKVKGKRYTKEGMLSKLSGKKLAPSIFIVPIQEANKMRQFLLKIKVNHKMYEVQSDGF